MRFTLMYTGNLPSNSNATVKHTIRQKIHPQLKELWRTHPALKTKNKWIGPKGADDVDAGVLLHEIGDYTFTSLVHPYLKLYAELDILVLRPDEPGSVISQSGDIDNQLKTLFDALRRPTGISELPRGWVPTPDQQPLFCLLDDDKLITRVNVEVDRLLDPASGRNDVVVSIRVTLRGSMATWGNLSLTG